MKGRTNISGGGMDINADVENFTVASGSNVTAGNFVQYKNEKSDRKYDTNTGCNENLKGFAESGNEAPKIIPCGNDKYVRRYKNKSDYNLYWFNLIDVRSGLRVLSTVSVSSKNIPGCCLLSDGNIALYYMVEENKFTIEIYNIESTFFLVNTYEFSNENIGEEEQIHATQLENGDIIFAKYGNCIICNYHNGEITKNEYLNLEINKKLNIRDDEKEVIDGDNDWNMYSVGENSFLIFPKFSNTSYLCLISIIESAAYMIDSMVVAYQSKFLNLALWGNAFGISGKVLFSDGKKSGYVDASNRNAKEYFYTKIYYKKNDRIMQTQSIDLLETARDSFLDLDSNLFKSCDTSSSGTAQYVKEDVFYVALTPQYNYSLNKKSRTAIYRAEYNQSSGMFNTSNIVTFDGDSSLYKFGYGQFFESNSGDVYYLYETNAEGDLSKSGRWIMKMTYKNGILEIGENTGMVENYTGSGAAIGVAKQSGKAGDVIEVYTPKV